MKKFLFALAILAALSLCSCSVLFSDFASVTGDVDVPVSPDKEDTTWAVYWYLCGSDLESNYGGASSDIYEMTMAMIPDDDVKIIIQTGGAMHWYTDGIDSDVISRCIYDNSGLSLIETVPQANMGEAETLSDFLSFCTTNYPAEHTMVVFWNHGAGSIGGASFDENYDMDSLDLNEMHEGFADVFELSPHHPPIDMIGFDCCLMATIDVANTFSDIASYLVASEELEPGNGWSYERWVQALADNPDMTPEELGIVLCDTYMEGCEEYGTEQDATLSLVNLAKIDKLLLAYEAMGQEALTAAAYDPYFFSAFGREAVRTENYGGNSPDEGYTNMVDLGHLARNSAELLPETQEKVLQGLEECVVYQVNGIYREEASGLSCYYSYDNDVDEFMLFMELGASESFKQLYSYEFFGALDDDGMEYLSDLGYSYDELPEIPTWDESESMDYPVYVDEEGYAVLEVGSEIADMLTGVYFELAYADPDSDVMLSLGRDNDIYADWENGIFKDNFRGVWGSVDGCLVYMELVYEGENYNTYSIPILLNGEEYNLRVVYDYDDEAFYIQGARRGLEDTGAADKNLVKLKPGDEITTIHYVSSMSGDDDFEPFANETITVTENTSFYEVDLGDGMFIMMFDMVDTTNTSVYSDLVVFSVENGEIYIIE